MGDATTDSEAMWDAAEERSLRRGSTTTSPPARGLRRLEVRPAPTCSARPSVRRTLEEVTPGLRECLRAVATGKAAWPLYLWGPAGTGKTSAALVLLDHCGVELGRLGWPEALRDWLAGLVDVRTVGAVKIAAERGKYTWYREGFGGAVAWEQLTAKLAKLPLVVFEEIGVGKEASDFRLDVLLEVLDQRANNPVRPFVVTSNLDPRAIERVYDDRVSSRVLAGTVFHLAGDDRRLARKPGS